MAKRKMSFRRGASRARGYARRHASKKIPLAPLVGAILSIKGGKATYDACRLAGWKQGEAIGYALSGWNVKDKAWHSDVAINTYAPVVGGIALHKAANRFGVNNAIKAVPLFKV